MARFQRTDARDWPVTLETLRAIKDSIHEEKPSCPNPNRFSTFVLTQAVRE
jgi:hypothetical protein